MTSIVFDYAAINKGMREKGLIDDNAKVIANNQKETCSKEPNVFPSLPAPVCPPELSLIKKNIIENKINLRMVKSWYVYLVMHLSTRMTSEAFLRAHLLWYGQDSFVRTVRNTILHGAP